MVAAVFLRSPRFIALVAFIVFLLVTSLGGCGDDPSRPPFKAKDCWMNVDTLFTASVSVADTQHVHLAFDAFVLAFEESGGAFPDSTNQWQYLSSEFWWEWEARHYWRVFHRSYDLREQRWYYHLTIFVDENGVVVSPFGCI